MTDKTIAEMDAEIAALERQRDIAALDGTKAVQTLLTADAVASLAADLEALIPDLPVDSVAAQQSRNVMSVLRNVTNLVTIEVSRIEALVEAQAPA